MPDTPRLTFRHLVLDVNDMDLMAPFWEAATGLVADGRGDEVALRDDAPEAERDPRRTLWLEKVPEKRTVKQRVHLDVHVRAVEDLLAAGATRVEDGHGTEGWTVLRDPEGGELCAFVRDDDRAEGYRIYELGVDCADPEAEARWWAERFGTEPGHDEDHPWWWVTAPHMPFESIVFNEVPEPKLVKNRLHWDVTGPAGEPGRHVADDLVAAGASLVAAPGDGREWWILTSPEGHEFCLWEGDQSA